MTIIFEVHLKPLSLNHYFGARGNRRFITKEGKEFKEKFQASFPQVERIPGKVSVSIHFKFKDNRKRDLDNHLKLLLDCMKDRLFEDDNQIFKLTASKENGCEFDAICVTVSSLNPEPKPKEIKKVAKINIISRNKTKNEDTIETIPK